MKPAQGPREISCDGREQLTERTARETVKRATWPAEPYHCVHCGKWHIGRAKLKGKPRAGRTPDRRGRR